MHKDEIDVDEELVHGLLESQMPSLAQLPSPGSDGRAWRLLDPGRAARSRTPGRLRGLR